MSLLDDATITRDACRSMFHNLGFSYDDVQRNDIYMLEALIAEELTKFNEESFTQMRIAHRASDAPRINVCDNMDCSIESAFIRVDVECSKGREAISFNRGGFIGFAGWADDTNVQPFLRAFIRWVLEWMDEDDEDNDE